MFSGGPAPGPWKPTPPWRLLRDGALDVDGVECEATDSRVDPLESTDRDDLARGERELGRRDEGVAREGRAGLAEVTKTEAPAPVLGTELVALPLGEIREAAAVCAGEVDRSRDRHVGAEAGQRLEDGSLGAVEPGRKGVYGDDEANSNGQPERGEDCATAPPPELRKHVGHVEHGFERNSAN